MNGPRLVKILGITFVIALGACGGGTGGNGGQNNSEPTTPTISGINPSAITSSSLPRTITVDGAGFQSGLTVTISTTSASTHPAPSQITSTSFQITAVFGIGSYSISVSNPGGQPSSPFSFAVRTAAGIDFAPPVNYPTGATSSGPGAGSGSIVIADFNDDGKLDIAVSNYASNTISVFLNKGDGAFSSPVVTTVNPGGALGLGPIVAGDFNEDGKMDLIVSTIAGEQSDIVLTGNGDGTFTQGAAIPNSFGFTTAKAIDLNGNKHLDLVGDGGSVSVALGNGDGTFSPTVYYSNGPFPDSYFGIDVGALTSNGKLDIVSADPLSTPGGIFVFPGNGDGTFGTLSEQPMPASGLFPSKPDSVALADFDTSGKLDLLIGDATGTAAVASGNGDYTFNLSSETVVYSGNDLANNGIYVYVADLDQDGKPDVLVLDYLNGVFAVVLNNASTISAGSKYSFTIAPGVGDLAVGDLNGDGMPDVAVVNDKTNQISVFLSQSQ